MIIVDKHICSLVIDQRRFPLFGGEIIVGPFVRRWYSLI